jgi:hypothetical protein
LVNVGPKFIYNESNSAEQMPEEVVLASRNGHTAEIRVFSGSRLNHSSTV